MKIPFAIPFTMRELQNWVLMRQPLDIELTDAQYSYLATMHGRCIKDFEGKSIIFLDAPRKQ